MANDRFKNRRGRDEVGTVTLRVPKALLRKIDLLAHAELRTRTNFCERVISEAINARASSASSMNPSGSLAEHP